MTTISPSVLFESVEFPEVLLFVVLVSLFGVGVGVGVGGNITRDSSVLGSEPGETD